MEVILFLVLVSLYFIPAIVAKVRDHHNFLAILMLNLLLGWSFIGWVVALIWASTKKNT